MFPFDDVIMKKGPQVVKGDKKTNKDKKRTDKNTFIHHVAYMNSIYIIAHGSQNIQSQLDSFWFALSRWRRQIETFSELLVLCAENSPVTGELPSQRPVTRSFDIFFDLRLNRRSSKYSIRRWFETLSLSIMTSLQCDEFWPWCEWGRSGLQFRLTSSFISTAIPILLDKVSTWI